MNLINMNEKEGDIIFMINNVYHLAISILVKKENFL